MKKFRNTNLKNALAGLYVSASVTVIANAGPISPAKFEERCKTITSRFNGAAGSRNLPFVFKNFQGADQVSTASVRILDQDPNAQCIATTRRANIKVQRFNDVTIPLRIQFANTDNGDVVIEDLPPGECFGDFYPYIHDKLSQLGYEMTQDFEAALQENVKNEYCPKFNAAVANEVLNVMKN